MIRSDIRKTDSENQDLSIEAYIPSVSGQVTVVVISVAVVTVDPTDDGDVLMPTK
jgi:hypothetical protein